MFRNGKLKRAAEQGDVDAMLDVAHRLLDSGDVDEASTWLLLAAEAGAPSAMNDLGVVLFHTTDDKMSAVLWWRRAVEHGEVAAMVNLGWAAHTAGDLEFARSWYERASQEGHSGAVHNLSCLLEETGDHEGALALCEQAATLGNPSAMNDLAVHLERDGDVEAAISWYRHAADAGNMASVESLHRLGQLGPGALLVDRRRLS